MPSEYATMDATPHTQDKPFTSRTWIAETRWFWIVAILTTAWKLLTGWKLGLIFDECTYWNWSLHPQACYYDHPPLTAWLIASGHSLLGHNPLAVRLWAIISGIFLAIAGRLLGREMFGPAAGNRAGIFLLLAPIFAGNALLMTPDTLLATAWAFAVLFAWKGSRPNGLMTWWLAAGAAAGVGMLSKYTMVLFYGTLGLLWLLSPGKRGRLFLGMTMASIVSFLFFLPVFWWNSEHHWISFARQLNHGFQNEHHSVINFQNLSDYTAFLIVLTSPLLGIFCFWTGATRLHDERFRFLSLFFWFVVIFFGISGAIAHVEANWPMVAFVTGLVMVAGDWERYSKGWKTAAIIILLVADGGAIVGSAWLSLPKYCPFAITNLSLDTSFIKGFPGSEKAAEAAKKGFGDFQSRIEEFLGPAAVADAVSKKFTESKADFLCISTIQLTGVLSYYAPELEQFLWLPDQGRVRLPWIHDDVWKGKTALTVEWPRSGPDYHHLFSRLTQEPNITVSQIKSPILISIGQNYDPSKVHTR